MKVRYYTYNKESVVTKHKFFITALIKVIYQSLILGLDSTIDKMYHNKGYYKQIFFIRGWLPFKFLIKEKEYHETLLGKIHFVILIICIFAFLLFMQYFWYINFIK